jgi:hypothetical protein
MNEMKKYLALIALTAMNFISFSQGLTPRVHREGKDTLFCFTISQSKLLAKTVEAGVYCDSVGKKLQEEISLFDQLTCSQDSSFHVLLSAQKNSEKIISNQEEIISDLKQQLATAKKQCRIERRQKRIMALGIVALSVINLISK